MRNFMEKSTVYFTDFRCKVGTSQLDKLKKLCIAAGIKNIDMDGKFVAIKMHFGELGNMAFLPFLDRPGAGGEIPFPLDDLPHPLVLFPGGEPPPASVTHGYLPPL